MKQSSNVESALTQFQLANAWHARGNLEEALTRYQETIRLHPNYAPAYQQLANLMLKQRRMEEALQYYEQALSLDFEAIDLSFYYHCLGLSERKSSSSQAEIVSAGNSSVIKTEHISRGMTTGKISLGKQRIFGFHRSGWNFAVQALSPLHNPHGVLFDGCLENQFLFQHNARSRSRQILAKMKADGVFQYLATSEEKGITPYQKPWVGFFHNPPAIPIWFHYHNSLQRLFQKQIWQDSLPHCIGLFALSNYHAEWLREQTGKPVSVLVHPTEIPEKQFDFHQFLQNPRKKVVQIGWWLRKLNSIYRLPLDKDNSLGYEKVRLGFLFDVAEDLITKLMQQEARIHKIDVDEAYSENTTVLQHLPNDEYDDLLAANIAFIDLYDASANNAVIECIARATPLLVNPLPSVKEYLGDEYPMYFNTLEEAAEKALDTSLILETHLYLKHCETRQKLSADYFLNSFCNSEVYRMI